MNRYNGTVIMWLRAEVQWYRFRHATVTKLTIVFRYILISVNNVNRAIVLGAL